MSSSPRFLRIAGLNYESLRKAVYSENKGLADRSYHQQQQFIFGQFYTYGDSISNGMQKLGYDAHEIVFDLEILQKKWAVENGFSYEDSNWQEQILLEQIRSIRPDIIYFQDIQALSKKAFLHLKQTFPFIKKLIIFRGYPGVNQPLLEILAVADLLFVGSPVLLKKCTDAGLKPFLMYHFFDKRILEKISPEPELPFTFIGSSGYGYGWNHQPRYAALAQLLQQTELNAWLEEGRQVFSFPSLTRNFLRDLLKTLPTSILMWLASKATEHSSIRNLIHESIEYQKVKSRNLLPLSPLSLRFPAKCRPPLFGIEMYKILAKSKISFNRHTYAAADTVDNIRLFQATGMGSCLLTDSGTNMRDLFLPDTEVVTYSSVEECIEKAGFLLKNERVRSEIALRGQKRTLESHTATHRCEQINRLIKSTS